MRKLNRSALRHRRQILSFGLEPLENRRLLSASFPGGDGGPAIFGGHGPGGPSGGFAGIDGSLNTIEFSQSPSAVQTGLNTLATADGLTDPAATDKVSLGDQNGVETYSVTLDGTGTVSRLAVDQTGSPVTQPTKTTTTWATLDGTGTGSDAAAANEITAIATALDLTAPTSTTVVNVTTTSGGASTYSVQLTDGDTTDDSTFGWVGGRSITVDADGNPVDDQALPFSVIPTAIQTGLNAGKPAGATALATDSTQLVSIENIDGVSIYSTDFTVTGTSTTVTVDSAGSAVTIPTPTTADFSTLPAAAQTELQTLATAYNVSTAISSTQTVNILAELSGTTLYSVTLSATDTDPSGNTHTHDLTITVDADGNPTVQPADQGIPPVPFNGGGHGGPIPIDSRSSNSSSGSSDTGSSAGTGDCGSGSSGSSGSTDSGSSGSSNNSSSGSASNNSSGSSLTAAGVEGLQKVSLCSFVQATNNAIDSAIAPIFSAGLAGVAPGQADSAVQADLKTIATDVQALHKAIAALSTTDRAALKTDEKAIETAIHALSETLAPLEKTLATDATKWRATLRSDEQAIRTDKNDATELAAAKSQLASDQSAAYTAITTDQAAIQTVIDTNAGVIAARAKLASDLPMIASAQQTLKSDYAQLQKDVEAQLASTSSV